ncbi:hypothetical protein V5799_014134 [Amblyomma americanum]|uniref:Uncharacterized protein n=1 Tax=Amblyomma americanum TaxID=6943 RepID=A0AAQ4E3W8_AMBAM
MFLASRAFLRGEQARHPSLLGAQEGFSQSLSELTELVKTAGLACSAAERCDDAGGRKVSLLATTTN